MHPRQFVGQQSAGVVFVNDSFYANCRAVVAVHYGNATAACADHNDALAQQQSDHMDFQNQFQKWGRHRASKKCTVLADTPASNCAYDSCFFFVIDWADKFVW
jgi:hypothetical protein